MEEYINQKMAEYAMNIDEFTIGQTVADSDGKLCIIKGKMLNSIEVFIEAKRRKEFPQGNGLT